MSAIEELVQCRSTLFELWQHNAELEMLQKNAGELPIESQVLSNTIAKLQNGINCLRRACLTQIDQALELIAGLGKNERKVLLLYYVMGYSLADIAKETFFHLRTVQKIKARALQKLDSEMDALPAPPSYPALSLHHMSHEALSELMEQRNPNADKLLLPSVCNQ